MKAQYLRVKNWERFQHYKDRTPPWIKYHVTLLDDRDMLSLPYATQLVYDRLLLWAARTDNNIDHDPIWLGQKFNIEPLVVQEAIENLLTAGFLVMAGRKRHASKAIATRTAKELAEREQGAVPEAEAESRGEADKEAEADGDSGGGLFAIPASADLQEEIQKLLNLRGCDANSRDRRRGVREETAVRRCG
jgi:hypothetical protein